MLTSLEIKNFRTFSHLAIERLGRVNLIVGKNDVGKTTLLEALRLIGSTWPAETIRSILEERNEVRPSADMSSSGERTRHYALESLFHGRSWRNLGPIEITAGSASGDNCQVTVTTELASALGDRDLIVDSPVGKWVWNADGSAQLIEVRNTNPVDLPSAPPPLVDILSGPEMETAAGGWWDEVWLPSGRERVLDLLKTVAQIEEVIFVRDPRSKQGRIAKAQIKDVKELMPLAAMGGGVSRLFYIALAMEFAAYRAALIVDAGVQPRDIYAFLLIDEIDSGIHHGLHADLWRFVLRAARQLGVQVFATTHSWDCLRGFAEAVGEDEKNDGLAIRLETVKGHEATRAVVIDRNDLPIVVRDLIEVR